MIMLPLNKDLIYKTMQATSCFVASPEYDHDDGSFGVLPCPKQVQVRVTFHAGALRAVPVEELLQHGHFRCRFLVLPGNLRDDGVRFLQAALLHQPAWTLGHVPSVYRRVTHGEAGRTRVVTK